MSAQIAIKSDGNPFFAFEIIRGLREGQFITQKDDGTWASTRIIDEIQIPSSVLDLVNARVADLTEEERDLLDVASCWGYEFDPALVGEVVGLARIPALKRFGQIERQHRLARSVGRNYVFDHHQVQEALYGGLNEQLREEYHSALAEALETRTKAADMHHALGSLRAAAGDEEGGRASLVAARDLAADVGIPGTETLSRYELALLPGGDAADALAAYAEHEERLSAEERQAARFVLWRATGDRAHLEEAKRLLDEQMTNYDEETRQRVVKVLRVPREIMAAWNGESGAGTPDDPDDDEPRGTESITRVG